MCCQCIFTATMLWRRWSPLVCNSLSKRPWHIANSASKISIRSRDRGYELRFTALQFGVCVCVCGQDRSAPLLDLCRRLARAAVTARCVATAVNTRESFRVPVIRYASLKPLHTHTHARAHTHTRAHAHAHTHTRRVHLCAKTVPFTVPFFYP